MKIFLSSTTETGRRVPKLARKKVPSRPRLHEKCTAAGWNRDIDHEVNQAH